MTGLKMIYGKAQSDFGLLCLFRNNIFYMLKIVKITQSIPLGLVVIMILSLFLRLLWLDRIPTGISDDELGFIINAKAVFLTGKDISGVWSPFSLTPITGGFPQAEIPYVI
jgi:hypothetical protein